ncbi:MAG: MFS transporter [Luteolibacter sp.]|uniref:MFS transporter n=1 Tax=Luteolibacter sp. TaxID=1962973 RepID=UPI003263B182
MFFLHGMTPGFWTPALTNILVAHGLSGWVTLVFVVPPLCALVSPLIGGALADHHFAANRLFAWSSFLGAVALFAAFAALNAGLHPWWFVGLLGLYTIFSGPSWGLLTTISLTHLPNGERSFPLVRLGATLGWMAAGLITSYVLHADTSPVAGFAAASTRMLGGMVAFMLPHTPPLGRAGSWKSRLGLDAFTLMKHRDHCVFFIVTAVYSIPLTAFYMYAPELLKVLGDQRSTATMTLAQLTEVAGMLLVGSVMLRFRVKTVLLWALGLSVVRFGMSAYAGASHLIGWHIGGIMLHGMCYTFYFITAQVFLDRRVDPGLRGQAQGLLAMVTSGLGPLAGAVVCGWLRNHCVTADGGGWMDFWAILASIIAVCFVIFASLYQGLGKPDRQS